LDDLIVGARNADPSGTVDAGKSYVVFGKTNNTAINLSAIAPPLTSPALETEAPLKLFTFSPLMTKPPVPRAIADRLIAVLLVLPQQHSNQPICYWHRRLCR
jgi:hypothetical protein